MKLNIGKEELFKRVSHFLLFWVSLIFSVLLFLAFTDNPFFKWVWFSMAIAVELLKNFLIMEIKTKYRSVHFLIITGFTLLYLSTAIVSSTATYGSVKLTLSEQEIYVDKMNISTDNIEFSIDQIDKKIERLNRSADASISEKEKMTELDDVYFTGISRMTTDMKLAEEEMESLLLERTSLTNSLKEEAQNTTSRSSDVFQLIGEDIGFTGSQTLFYIFLILIVVLEVALFATTSSFEITIEKEESEADMVCRYVDALEKDNSVVLNSDINIAEITGISRKDCKRYRALLNTLKHRGKTLISGNRASFNSSTAKRVVREYFEKESEV